MIAIRESRPALVNVRRHFGGELQDSVEIARLVEIDVSCKRDDISGTEQWTSVLPPGQTLGC